LSDIEFFESRNCNHEQQAGTLQLKRKIFGLRPKKQGIAEMLAKLKTKVRILLEYELS